MQLVEGEILFPPKVRKTKRVQANIKPEQNKCTFLKVHGVLSWRKGEWITFSLLLLLGMYAVGGFSANLVYLHMWSVSSSPSSSTPSLAIINTLLVVQTLVFLGVVSGQTFLLLRRDFIAFIVTYVFLLASSLIFLALLLFAICVLSSDRLLMDEIYNYIESKLSLVGYLIKFYNFQEENKCCGVRDFKDWETLGPPLGLVKGKVPESCCSSELIGRDRTICAANSKENEHPLNVLNEDSLYSLQENIYTTGCGIFLTSQYKDAHARLLIESLFVFILVVCIVVLIYFVFYRWKQVKVIVHRKFEDPREQEDDIESDIIPGTPAKSYLSTTEEGNFYAPVLAPEND